MSQPTIVPNQFSIERVYPVSVDRVFSAFQDIEKKRVWFFGAEGFHLHEVQMDFRVGGIEFSRFDRHGGPEMTNRTLYHDIVENQRIVFDYEMTFDKKLFSVSLASVELFVVEGGTRLVYTEASQHLDGFDKPGPREAGCKDMFDRLGATLE
jgi:uncharacterized protein YndB with AHSA1/START domain